METSLISAVPVIERGFYQRPTERVAEGLLGKLIVRREAEGLVAIRILEVEAYLGVDDPACHTHGGRRTPRVASMWGPAGHAYVYRIYGLHHCLNVVTVGEECPQAVLIRGGQVVAGRELAARRRGAGRPLARGPGMLCQAAAITLADDGADLCVGQTGLWVADDGWRIPVDRIDRLPRIGVAYAGEAALWPLRFVLSR